MKNLVFPISLVVALFSLVAVTYSVSIAKTKKYQPVILGKEITIERLVEIMLELEQQKAHNINLVTPTHFVPSIKEAIIKAREKGLAIPIVYNSSGYESKEMLQELKGLIDIYLCDFKYFDNQWGEKLSHCQNYRETVISALEEMFKQTGPNIFDQEGVMKKGIIVRILCLPTLKEDNKKIIHYLYDTYQDQIYLSIMNQYTPVTQSKAFPFLNETLTEEDYEEILNDALDYGVKKAYIQEGKTCTDSFIPMFDLEGVEKEMSNS